MIDKRFSSQEFDARGLDTSAARKLAGQLRREVEKALHEVVACEFLQIIDRLNTMGHSLRACGRQKVGELAYRDYGPSGRSEACRLRLAVDTVVSAGYAHLLTEDELASTSSAEDASDR